ncbi:MAG: transglycosylase SLT domain-containing protein [Gammaproteobacteria bacterium]|nr:transglycosylase SLT domain-containing protein [Gammaproteobacteria bacterium]
MRLCCRSLPALLLCITPFIWTSAHADGANTLEQQRSGFLAARQALDKGDMKTYQRLADQLRDYPLYPYLRYDELRQRIADVPEGEIRDFLSRYSDSAVSSRLRAAWLSALISAKQWQTYLQEYRPYPNEQGVALRCYELLARYRAHEGPPVPPGWFAEVQELWLTGKSQPGECDGVFKLWRAAGHLTPDLSWQRIRLAMDNRQTDFADLLAKELGADERQWVQRFQRMHNNPGDMLVHADFKRDTPKARDIVRHGVKRLARTDAAQAAVHWQRIKSGYTFSPEEIGVTERDIAVSAALQRLPQALDWLAAINPDQADERVRQWRVRAALARQDWRAGLAALDALTPAEREDEQWRYWRARALEQAGSATAGVGPHANPEQLYTSLAQKRSYYGFLAADRLQQPYVFNDRPIELTEAELGKVSTLPGIMRCRELYQLDLIPSARREWDYVTAAMGERERQLAAVIASRWGWHDRSIFTLAKAEHNDDLELRFPTAFRDQVLASAEQQGLDPAWIYGVIRQESAFMPDARSSAGALGLMQLMPATGKQTAKLLNSPLRHINDLLEIDKNIQVGSAYLRHVLDKNNDHQALATASYNAGPSRIRQWLPDSTQKADIWVENIPFTETRNYVQQVMAYSAIFGHRLGRAIVPLRERMPDVPAYGE